MQTILNPLDGFFPALLRASWQAGALVLVVLAAQRLLARRLPPRWRYALWLIVLARLLLPVSVPSPASVFNFLHVPTTPGTRNEGLPPRLAPAFAPGAPGAAAQPDFSAAPAVDSGQPAASDASPPALDPVETASAAAPPSAPPLGWRRLAAWLWLAGVVGFAAVLAVQTIGLARRLRQTVPITEERLLRLLEACRAEMGVPRPVGLCETAAVSSPALCGVFRPRLLLPRGLAGRLSQPELRHVLLHELAHLKRHDLALNWLATALQVLHWFNPLVWLAGARMRADRELACDALALEAAGEAEKQAYGETILRLLEGFTHTARLPGLVGILEDRRQLRRRIRAIAGFRKPSRRSALAAVLVAGLAVVGLTDAKSPQAAKKEDASAANNSAVLQTSEPSGAGGIRGRVVDTEGRPIADAVVKCTDFPWQMRTDANGHFAWPDTKGTHEFTITHFGYRLSPARSLAPGKQEHTIVLLSAPIVMGRVLDRDSHQPISQFHVYGANLLGRAGGPMIYWGRVGQKDESGSGRFKLDSPFAGRSAGEALLVDAEGYAPMLSRPLGPADDGVTLTFELVKAPKIKGKVLTPDGQPAVHAQVYLLATSLADRNMPAEYRPETDEHGEFTLPPWTGGGMVTVSWYWGYAEVSWADFVASPVIRLKPWAHVKGKWPWPRPVPARFILDPINWAGSWGTFTPRFQTDFTTVEGDGSFDAVVPEGEYRLKRFVWVPASSGSSARFGLPTFLPARSQEGTIKTHAGETNYITLERGTPVVGRIASAAALLDTNSAPAVAILTPPLPPVPEFKKPDYAKMRTGAERFVAAKQYAEQLEGYWLSPEGKARRRAEATYVGSVQPDGTFRIEDVPPGTYDLSVRANGLPLLDGSGSVVATVESIRVPKPPATGDTNGFDLGVIQVPTEAQATQPKSDSEARKSEEPVKGLPREELRWGTLTFAGQPLANMKVRLRCRDRGVFDGMTDAEGRLRLRRGLCEDLETVWCEKGYAEVKPGTLADGFHYELKPVGRIEGWLHFGDSAATNELLRLWPVPLEAPRPRLSTEMVQTWTDQTGHFVFPVVPPGRWRICLSVADYDKGRQPLNAKRGVSSAFAGLGRLTWIGGFESLVDVRPGQTSRVDLGRGSRTVIGKVVSEQPKRPFRWTIVSGSLGPDTNTRADREPSPQAQKELEQADREWRQYLPEFAADGKFTIRAVPPGDYVLSLHYGAFPAAGSATREPEEGWAGGMVHVPAASAGQAAEPVDAGTFTVQPVNPRKTADIAPPTTGRTDAGVEARLPALRTALGQKDGHVSAAGGSRDGRLWGTVFLDGKTLAGSSVSYFDGVRTMGGSGRTDQNGRVFVYPNPTAKKLIVWHEGLQAALDAQKLTNEFRVDLRSLLGGVEGRLWWGDKPWPGKTLNLRRRWPADVGPAGSQMNRTNLEFELRAKTDADGRFAFPNVPAGEWLVRSGRIQWGSAEVKPGEIARLDLGREGVAITGRAVTDSPGRTVNWPEAWVTLRTDLNGPDVRFYAGEVETDGTFIVPRVTPGAYQLFIAPEGFPAAGPSPFPMTLGGSGPVSVVVLTNSAATNRVIDLGAVTVKMGRQLKIGDLAPPFEMKTFDGQPVQLADFQGKVVLLCLWWASPYSIDRQRLKDLTLLRQQYRQDDRLVILGVNLNQDAAEAEAVIAEEKWDWLQTRAADRAAFFRDEYELQSTPALLVIGPDGRVRARNYNVDGIRSALWAAVEGQRNLNPQGSILRCKVDGLSMEFTNMVKAYYTPKDGLGIFSVGGDRWISPDLTLHGPALRKGRFTLEDTPGLVLDYSKNGASSDSRSHYEARAGMAGVSAEVNVQEVGAVGEKVVGTFSAVVKNTHGGKVTLTDGYFSAIREAPISASDAPALRR